MCTYVYPINYSFRKLFPVSRKKDEIDVVAVDGKALIRSFNLRLISADESQKTDR